MAQSATVTLGDDGIIEVRHGPGSGEFAGYLGKVLDQLNNPKNAQATVMAKAKLGDLVVQERTLKQEKAQILRQQSEDWLAKSRETTLSPEIREYLEEKARRAVKAAGEIQQELDGHRA
jgi:hypothetical protein